MLFKVFACTLTFCHVLFTQLPGHLPFCHLLLTHHGLLPAHLPFFHLLLTHHGLLPAHLPFCHVLLPHHGLLPAHLPFIHLLLTHHGLLPAHLPFWHLLLTQHGLLPGHLPFFLFITYTSWVSAWSCTTYRAQNTARTILLVPANIYTCNCMHLVFACLILLSVGSSYRFHTMAVYKSVLF